jgi:predicted Zn-dependent protease
MDFEDYREERFRALNGIAPGERLIPGRLVKIVSE